MPAIDGPVCLTYSAPADVYAGQLLVYDVVPPSAVSRSGFLSSIVEAGGDVRLPDFVTLSEFKAWTSTIATKQTAADLNIAQACIVLKVRPIWSCSSRAAATTLAKSSPAAAWTLSAQLYLSNTIP